MINVDRCAIFWVISAPWVWYFGGFLGIGENEADQIWIERQE